MYAFVCLVIGMTIFMAGLRIAGGSDGRGRKMFGLVAMIAGTGLVVTAQALV